MFRRGSRSRRGAASLSACTSFRAPRNAFACALPRPSAMASAKFANSRVNHSQILMPKMKPFGASPRDQREIDKIHGSDPQVQGRRPLSESAHQKGVGIARRGIKIA
jgi:hypothetical protein